MDDIQLNAVATVTTAENTLAGTNASEFEQEILAMPNAKVKASWRRVLIRIVAIMFLGIISGTIMGLVYKNYLNSLVLDYSQFNESEYVDDTFSVLSVAMGINSPTQEQFNGFVPILKEKGKTPQDYTPSQNTIMALHKASLATSFSSIGTGRVSTIAAQEIYSERKHDGSKYTFVSLSTGLLTVATCAVLDSNTNTVTTIQGSNVKSDSATWDGTRKSYSAKDFEALTGNLPSTILPYLISSKTVLNEDAQIVKTERNGKEVYEYTMNLHNIYSVLRYQNQVKYTSGLSDAPTFKDISIKVILDADWNLVRTEIVEHYTIVYGVRADCEGTLYSDYTFNEPVTLPV